MELISLSDSASKFEDITSSFEINSQDLKLQIFTTILQIIAGNPAITHWIYLCINKVVFAC
jgi:hypothetical protein